MAQSKDNEASEARITYEAVSSNESGQIWAIWCHGFLLAAMAGALTAFALGRLWAYIVPKDIDLNSGVYLCLWLVLPLSALVSFGAALACHVFSRRDRCLLWHGTIVLCDAVIMTAMYMYPPWIIGHGERTRIVYDLAGATLMPGEEPVLCGTGPCMAVGRLSDQYMLVIIASCIATMPLLRSSKHRGGLRT